MFEPHCSALHPAREPKLTPPTARALLLAMALPLLAPAIVRPAAAGAPATGAAPPPVKPGASCPIPERPNAADGSLRGFAPAPNLYLEIDGKEAPAEIYQIYGTAVLVVSSRLRSPVVLKGYAVAAVPAAKIEKRPDGTVDVRRDAVLEQLGAFTATSDSASFSIGGHRQVVRQRAPLDFLRAPGAPATPPHG